MRTAAKFGVMRNRGNRCTIVNQWYRETSETRSCASLQRINDEFNILRSPSEIDKIRGADCTSGDRGSQSKPSDATSRR